MIDSDRYVTIVLKDLSPSDLGDLLHSKGEWCVVSRSHAVDDRDELLLALDYAEAALSDIGDAEREPGDDLKWCEDRAAQALPRIRSVLRDHGRKF